MQIEHPDRGVILIAERDQNVRELQSYFLGQAGFTVEFADDGPRMLDQRRAVVGRLQPARLRHPTAGRAGQADAGP